MCPPPSENADIRTEETEADQSALLIETLLKAPLSEMLLRRWGRTLAKNGITLEAMPEGKSSWICSWMRGRHDRRCPPPSHNFHMMSYNPYLVDGKTVRVSPLNFKGINGDFDRDDSSGLDVDEGRRLP